MAVAGGAIFQEKGQATVQETTISLNVGGIGTSSQGLPNTPGVDGIEVLSGALTEVDTIVSKDVCQADPFGRINDGFAPGDGHVNLSFPTSSCPGIVADPLLGPLQANGGLTETMAIAPSSPAIDKIVPGTPKGAAGCTPTDQRGIIRPQPAGGKCDIGAYEYAP